jgi:hypothetical protein
MDTEGPYKALVRGQIPEPKGILARNNRIQIKIALFPFQERHKENRRGSVASSQPNPPIP